jgi:hypothetical protein
MSDLAQLQEDLSPYHRYRSCERWFKRPKIRLLVTIYCQYSIDEDIPIDCLPSSAIDAPSSASSIFPSDADTLQLPRLTGPWICRESVAHCFRACQLWGNPKANCRSRIYYQWVSHPRFGRWSGQWQMLVPLRPTRIGSSDQAMSLLVRWSQSHPTCNAKLVSFQRANKCDLLTWYTSPDDLSCKMNCEKQHRSNRLQNR